MSDQEKNLTKLAQRLERASRQLEVSVVMQNLMVLQLDGEVEISNETMRLYLGAVEGSSKKVEAFRKHVMERYFT